MAAKRVVFIGIDGAALELITPWMKNGILPNFAKLAATGIMAPLRTVIPPMTATGWVSLSTGKNPGKHGIFDFYRMIDYEKQVISSRDVHAQHVWQIAGRAGKKVIVVNPPVSYPPDEVNGYFIGGMLTPSYESDYTYPKALKQELSSRGYSIGVELDPGLRSNFARSFVMNKNRAHREKLIRVFNDIDERRVGVIEMLAGRIAWDFIYVMFEGTDRLEHYYWNDDDFYVIREHYRKIDELIGRLMKFDDGNTAFIIGSDHGFEGIRYKFFINNFLEYHGLLTPGREAGCKNALLKHGKNAALALAGLGLPVQRILALPSVFKFYRELYRPFIDWGRTKAFMFNETSRGIWINLKNRQKNGTVDKAEYNPIRNFIVEHLNGLTHPSTGERIITAYKREDVFSGVHTHNAPDILLVTQKGYSVEPVLRPASGSLADNSFTETIAPGERNADHAMDGLFMMAGSGIAPKRRPASIHITDIAPTILSLMGIDYPEDMDGKPVQ
ncbi:MAG: alkaline phosphatase family protein [Candidatus Omnitrophica bacterium]|nr:alkaline phosphatase family protein [Candidatus Omnitrophota bacterium]